TLEEDGFVVRTIYPEVPPRVEYTLTPRAESLLPHLEGLIGWAIQHQEAIIKDRKAAATNKR
ncbi:MAG: helix-turn-helix transcriptional regulator, partial [Alistipes sp.]|nr:helix-turn-helix transcriptional regulator [Alistipes sp.]